MFKRLSLLFRISGVLVSIPVPQNDYRKIYGDFLQSLQENVGKYFKMTTKTFIFIS
jgi:hypothetical protein